MTNAIGYARVSSEAQDEQGYSLPTQRTAIKAYARQHGLTLVEILSEDASGLTLNRPQLARLRRMLSDGQARTVIAYDSDRLSRDPFHSILLRDEWQRAGVQLHYVQQGRIDLDDTMDQAIQDLRARLHRYEVEQMVERSQRGKRGAVSAGKVLVNDRPPYGYEKSGDTLAIVPEEAETVKLIFELYLSGQSTQDVADELSRRGIITRGDQGRASKTRGRGQWQRGTVLNILHNETYAGTWHYGKVRCRYYVDAQGRRRQKRTPVPRAEWTPVEVPAIIERATWQAVQRLFPQRQSRSRRNQTHDYLLARRLTCGCGATLRAKVSRPKPGLAYRYYYCSRRPVERRATPVERCQAAWVRAEELDTLIWDWIKAMLREPGLMIALIEDQIAGLDQRRQAIAGQLAGLSRQRKRKEAALARLYREAAEDTYAAKAIKQAKIELRDELAGLERQAATLAIEAGDGREAELRELGRLFGLYREGLALKDEPFNIRLGWVEALNLQGVVADGEIEITCDLGRWVLSIAEGVRSLTGHSWPIRQRLKIE